MLGLMRKHATSWLIKVALFAIVIVFIFWGGYSYTERRASRIAVVNGSYIGIREYQTTYNNLLEQLRRQLGKQFSSQLVETLKLKEQALDRLISRRLLLAEAKRLGLEVSRTELQNAIRSYPAFQNNGQFDSQRYMQTLRYLRLTPQEFEASQLEDLLIAKVERFITRGTKVLDTEVLSFFHQSQDEVNLAYVQIDPDSYTDQVEVDEEAIKHYFEEHRETYRLVAKRDIVYVRFALEEYLDEVQPSPAEVEEYYRLHQDDYQEVKKVRARHILFKIAAQKSASEVEDITARAREVLALARRGEDFADLARKYSEDSTASKGGDLGYFTRADMVKPFADAAFSLNKGEISNLVRTRFGLHIIKVEDIKEGSTRPLAEVEQVVLRDLKKELARDIVRQRAESFADTARALDDLRKAAAEKGLPVRESGFFGANEVIPQLGRNPDLSQVVFSLKPKEISSVLSVGEDQLVVQLEGIQDSRLPELKEVKGKVQKDWLTEQSKVIARDKAQELLSAAQKKRSLAQVARRNGLKLKETGLFTSFSPVPPLRNRQDLIIAAFALTPEHPLASEVYEVDGDYIIFQLLASHPAPEEKYQQERDAIAKQLLQAKREQTFNRWLTALRQQSEIRVLQEL